MKRVFVKLIFLVIIFILAGCEAAPTATPAPPTQKAGATATSVNEPQTRPSPPLTPSPPSLSTPLPPEAQALLGELEMTAQELFSTLDRAQAENYPQELIDEIIRNYVKAIEDIEAQLAAENVPFTPLDLPPTPAVAARKEVFDAGMVTADGVHLAATYYRPAATNAPGVVLLHMLGRNRGDWDSFARQLQELGYAVLTIDFRGHGESEGKREWSKMTLDAAIAASFIRARPEVDPDQVVLMGASIGANIAINYAAQDDDISGVALLSPGLDYHGVKTADAVKQYGPRPLFIAASSEDEYAAKSARKLASLAAGPHQLLILDNQGHGTQMLGKDNGLGDAIFQWLARVASREK